MATCWYCRDRATRIVAFDAPSFPLEERPIRIVACDYHAERAEAALVDDDLTITVEPLTEGVLP